MAKQDAPKLYGNLILSEAEPIEMVQRSLDSIKDYVDGLYITVTYKKKKPTKSHKLLKLLEKYKANVSLFKWVDNFAVARQFALEQVPKGENIFVYWQDADDILKDAHNLPQVLEEMYQNKIASVFFSYWYQVDFDENGEIHEVLIEHKRERIFRNDDTFEWVGDLHETLIEKRQENVLKILKNDCVVVHLSTPDRVDKNIDRNVRILEESLRNQKQKDPRTVIYLAKCYYDKAKMSATPAEMKIHSDLALTLFHQYLNGVGTPGQDGYQEPSGWAEERSTAYGYVAELAILSGQPDIAIEAYKSAIDEFPYFPNYYIDLAACYTMINDYKQAKHWLKLATSVDMPTTTIVTTPRDMKIRALEVAMNIAVHEGKLEDAEKHARAMVNIMPTEQMWQDKLEAILALNKFNKACQSVVFLGKYLEDVGEDDKVKYLLKSMSKEMNQERFAAEMRSKFLPPKVWENNEIAIVCGPGFEEWSPNSLEKGLGGSEEAVVHLSRELTELGWKVTVYANPGSEQGEHDGVNYVPWFEFNHQDKFNAIILWRTIGLVDANLDSKFTMVWMHDVPNNPDFTEERINKVDKIAVLSEFHKSLFRMNKDGKFVQIPEHKFFLTANGIADLKPEKWNGNSKRLIYASSPDRGLIYLLQNWGKVISEVPDAELHVYYGFDVFDAIHKNNPARMQWKQQVLDLMEQPGITYHGRVGHTKLHEEYSKSGYWAYPTDFEEISCISAMKAQALGAIPVVTNYAALEETVKNGVRVDVDIRTKDGQEEYIQTLINLLKEKEEKNNYRKNMMKFARDYFSWSNVAKQWSTELSQNLSHPENKFLVKE